MQNQIDSDGIRTRDLVGKIKKSIFFKNDQKYFFSCQKYFFHVDSPPVWNKSVFEKILKNFSDPLQNFF